MRALTSKLLLAGSVLLATITTADPLAAQGTGTVQGTVTRSDNSAKIQGANVSVRGTGLEAQTGTNGHFTIQRVPAGEQTLLVRWVGYKPQEVKVTVVAGGTATADVTLETQPIMLSEIIVSTASRTPERVVEAPAAVTLVDTRAARSLALTGQTALAIANVPGVDVVQSGVNDMNVNTRGFNSTLNRRILVLQDGRDLSITFIGAQEWGAMSTSLEDLGKMEIVRGPGAALYGANAFSGVLSITTPSARELAGTRLSVGAGELNTFRADVRHAGVLNRGQIGYKFTGGYTTSDTWSRSRTAGDSLDLRREYTDAIDPTQVSKLDATGRPAIEAVALNGQTIGAGGIVSGDRKSLLSAFGTARLDYYAANGAVGTVEGGGSRVENEVFVTGIGRVQIRDAFRPWFRANWGSEHYNVMGWYSGRTSPAGTPAHQVILSSGTPLVDHSGVIHFEGQYNRAVMQDKLRFVLGASFRNSHENTEGTLMALADDNRNDKYYSGYGQVEYRPSSHVRVLGASRWDDGTLFKPQFSPKGALVISPNQHHSFRATVNRAFQTPSYSEFYVRAPAGAPTASPATLEGGLELLWANVRAAIPAVATAVNLPAGCVLTSPTTASAACLPWDFPAQTLILGLGNRNLDVEKVTGLELGYKGDISTRVFVSLDGYYNFLSNFVTDLLGGVNPSYPSYSLSTPTDVVATLNALDAALAGLGLPAAHPLRANIPTLRGGYQQLAAQLGSRIGTDPLTGRRSVIVSYTNAGKVQERGVEFGAGVLLTNELRMDASYTFFDFTIEAGTLAPGDSVLPNTPKHKGSLSLMYTGRQGLELGLSTKIVDSFRWAAGVFAGQVPGSQTFNANISYRVNNNIRIHAIGTNILNQQRYQMYGGSVIGRRILGGITAEF
ncbi:MAG: TonB-dependent receptor [Gemmatimonadetes bacterium]|nr:TonB-dependent receptor [Gemmatimonadota bacterium]